MRVLHITISMEASWGGPSSFVAGLASAQARQGARVTVASSAPANNPQCELASCGPDVDVQVFPQGRFAKFWTSFSPAYARFIQSAAEQYDVIHAHELWHYPLFITSRETRRRHIPLVVSPHGCLAPLALANDRLLKRIYSPLVQRPILNNASLVHALTLQEQEDALSYGASSPTTVMPAGVEIGRDSHVSAAPKGSASSKGNKPFEILFLGRIIPNKGPGLLIDALASLGTRGYDAKLTLAGPCRPDYRAQLQGQAGALGVAANVSFPGFVTGVAKDSAFSAADLFALPSYTEGFSIAVLEAMAHGLPVVLTPQCNFPEAAEAGASLEVVPEAGPLAEALAQLMVSPEKARQMGIRGRALVEEKYSWDTVAAQLLDAYRQLAAYKPKPRLA